MRLLLLVGVALLATLLDLTLSSKLSMWGGHPSLSLAVVATWAVLRPRAEVMLLTPLCGVGLGVLGNEPIGASLIGLTIAALLGWSRSPESSEGRLLHALSAAFAAAMAYVATQGLIVGSVDRDVPHLRPLIQAMLGAAILTVPLAGMLYLPLVRTAWRPRSPMHARRL